jgi:hypothetical protein
MWVHIEYGVVSGLASLPERHGLGKGQEEEDGRWASEGQGVVVRMR